MYQTKFVMHKIIEDLNWRYATKKFDASKRISDTDLEIIKESLRLTPSSYGLQPLQFLIVENSSVREQLVAASYGQMQVKEASHLIVICAISSIQNNHVDDYVENVIETRNADVERVNRYGDFMKKTFAEYTNEEKLNWASKQAYIVLGQLLHTCASLRIDATPMEGFIVDRYSEILELSNENLTPVLVCPIGYRHEDDPIQHDPKIRKSIDDLFRIIE